MQKKYPEDVMKVYNLFIEYSEKVEELFDRLNMENQRLGEKLMKVMEPMGIDAEAGNESETA